MAENEPATERSAPDLFSFEIALAQLKSGARVTRACWSEGSFLAHKPGDPTGIPINANTSKAMGLPEGTVVNFAPYLMAYDADRKRCAPWVATQSDIFATDWRAAA